MPAVHIEESDLKPSADTLKRNPHLRSIDGGQSRKAEKGPIRSSMRAKGESAGTKSTADDSRAYPKLRAARRETQKRGRVGARAVGRSAVRGARVQTSRATASLGSILVLITGAGITFAIIRNPRIITAPLGFLTSIFSRFTGLFGAASARNTA